MSACRDARARHPSAQWKPDVARMTRRVAERLAAQGHPWPDRAATILADRGRLGLDRAAYAQRVGLDPDELAGLEDGRADS